MKSRRNVEYPFQEQIAALLIFIGLIVLVKAVKPVTQLLTEQFQVEINQEQPYQIPPDRPPITDFNQKR